MNMEICDKCAYGKFEALSFFLRLLLPFSNSCKCLRLSKGSSKLEDVTLKMTDL